MVFECVSRTDVGLRRKVNEDSLLVRTDRGLWAVADGMGGHDAGDVASAKVTEALMRLPVVYGLDNLVESAIAALQRVNQELIAMATSNAPANDRKHGRRPGHSRWTLLLLLGRRQPRLRLSRRPDPPTHARS